MIEAIQNKKFDNPIVLYLVELLDSGNSIVFCWTLSHIGINGNEKADKAAKQALNK